MLRKVGETAADWIVIGQIGAPFGVKGWSHVRSFARPAEGLFEYQPWHVQDRATSERQPLDIEEWRSQGKGFVVKLRGIDDRDGAAALVQKWIMIRTEQRAVLEVNEFYWNELEGLAVQLLSGQWWGRIEYLYENVGTDVMVIRHEGKEYQVPFIFHDTVVEVDRAAGKVVLDWSFDYPEG